MKKVICVLVVLSLVLVLFTGCSNLKFDKDSNSGTVSSSSSNTKTQDEIVVGHFNGKEIYLTDVDYTVTSNDVGADFMTFQKSAITNYAYKLAIDEFLKDVKVEDSDVEGQLEYYKAIAEANDIEWDMYLLFYVGLTEDALKKEIASSLREQTYIKALGEEIGISESEISAYYEENRGHYDNVAMDIIPFSDVETYESAIEKYDLGYSLEEISEALDIEILEERYINVESDMSWNVDLSTVKVGDMVYSLNTSDDITLAMGKVVKVITGLSDEQIKENVRYDLVMTKGSEEGNTRLNDFLKTVTFDVFGEDTPLYQIVEEEKK